MHGAGVDANAATIVSVIADAGGGPRVVLVTTDGEDAPSMELSRYVQTGCRTARRSASSRRTATLTRERFRTLKAVGEVEGFSAAVGVAIHNRDGRCRLSFAVRKCTQAYSISSKKAGTKINCQKCGRERCASRRSNRRTMLEGTGSSARFRCAGRAFPALTPELKNAFDNLFDDDEFDDDKRGRQLSSRLPAQSDESAAQTLSGFCGGG